MCVCVYQRGGGVETAPRARCLPTASARMAAAAAAAGKARPAPDDGHAHASQSRCRGSRRREQAAVVEEARGR